MLRRIIGGLIVIAIMVSCGEKTNSQSSSDSKSSSGTILAKVNGDVLTLEDLLQQFPAESRDQVRGEYLAEAVDTWVNTQLLAQAGIKKGLDKDAEVEAVMRFRKSDAIARRLVEVDITNMAAPTASEIDSAYNADKERFSTKLRVSHILVGSLDEAQAIHNRLKKGDDFAILAKDYSGDKQSAANGGDLGFFTTDQIDQEFARAAMQLKVGEYSEPVQTPYGYHLIKLTDRQAMSGVDSLEVRGKIVSELTAQKQALMFQDLMDSLKFGAKIEKFSPPGLGLQGGAGQE